MKNQLALLIYLLFSLSYTVTAQDCLTAGITFSTQKQIDNFPTNYPGCTNIKGNIRIEERKANSIINLNSLSQITSIEGNLIVSNNKELNSLKGLNNLTKIGGQLGIWGNSSLVNLAGLENLNSIDGHLTISKNNSLRNLEGLNKLITIGGFFRVKENNFMTSLSGLNQLFSIGKDLWVHSNDNLKSIDGLENLTSIKGNLLVTENENLKNLNGLNNLVFIGKSLKIRNNDSLVSLSVLNNVSSIGGRINIASNTSLIYHNELEKLSSVSEKEIKNVKGKINQNEKVKKANNDRKWKFGAEAGIASIKLKKSERGRLFDSRNEDIKRSSKSGFRVAATARYNIDNRFYFIGGLGFVKAKGTANKTITNSKGGLFSPAVRTTINENITQDYMLLEIPVYLRMHLLGKHFQELNNFNLFFDLGMSYKKPLGINSSYTRSERISTTVTTIYLFSSTPSTSTTTSTYSNQEGDLKLQSELSEYFALGFLIGDRASFAFTSTGINTQGKTNKSIKFKSRLNSVAVTVFF